MSLQGRYQPLAESRKRPFEAHDNEVSENARDVLGRGALAIQHL